MTPAEWLTSTDPDAMLAAARDRASDRQLFLFACGAARGVWDRLGGFGRAAVPLVEAAADGHGTDEDRRAAVWGACEAAGLPPLAALVEWLIPEGGPISEAIRHIAWYLRMLEAGHPDQPRGPDLLAAVLQPNGPTHVPHAGQANLLRCVLGHPFTGESPPPPKRTVRDWFRGRTPLPAPAAAPAFDPAWRTTPAVDLARVIYHDREFDLMPILADALQDAGCSDEAALGHCRGGGPHARGCWVVDQVLGKK